MHEKTKNLEAVPWFTVNQTWGVVFFIVFLVFKKVQNINTFEGILRV